MFCMDLKRGVLPLRKTHIEGVWKQGVGGDIRN
jgi:hypothetical protein